MEVTRKTIRHLFYNGHSFGIGLLIFAWMVPLAAQTDVANSCASGKIGISSNGRFAEARQSENQHAYDIHYYDLDLRLRPEQKTIDGTVGIGFLVVEDSLDRIELDLTDNYLVTKVEGISGPLTFLHENDLLVVLLGAFISNATEGYIKVYYRGSPGTNAFNFDTRNGQPLIWSLSEPFGAREWWPCKNYPFDKADSARISITVPEGLVAGSNGFLESEQTVNGWTSFVWKEQYPIASYLISVAVHPYRIHRDYFHYTAEDSMEMVHYIFPDHYDEVASAYDQTTEMIAFYSDVFGLYPFIEEKYGHAEFPWNGGMEHQTLTSILGPYEYLIAHELAHQWWGNMITCKDFHHIWLNEGFATYAEALWAEHRYGKQAYFNKMNEKIYLGGGTIYVPDLEDEGRIFSGPLSYNKASWVLHMLRHLVGDESFFEILTTYGNSSKKYGVATTVHFQAVCESVSGKDLDDFFDQWIYNENHPVYSYEWTVEPEGSGYRTHLTIAQDQAFPLFSLPVDIGIGWQGGDTTLVIQNEFRVQNYSFYTAALPNRLNIDPEGWILKEVNPRRNMLHHNNNGLLLSLSDQGAIGFDAPNGSGNGLIFPPNGENLIYFGSLMIGNGLNYLADTDIQSGLSDFERKSGSRLGFVETEIKQQGDLVFTDAAHPYSKGHEVEQTSRSYAMENGMLDHSVILDYKVMNPGGETLENVYLGVFMDLDIGYYLDNRVSSFPEEQMVYQYNGLFAGVKALNYHEKTQLIAIRNALDKFSETSKSAYLTGVLNDYQENTRDDWSVLLSVGPFDIPSGGRVDVPVAIIAAADQTKLLEAARNVQEFHDLIDLETTLTAHSKSVEVFPNPTTGALMVTMDFRENTNVHMILYDLYGRVIDQQPLTCDQAETRANIDLSGHAPGVYVLQIRAGNRFFTRKILKH